MTFSCLSAATSAGMVPRIAVREQPVLSFDTLYAATYQQKLRRRSPDQREAAARRVATSDVAKSRFSYKHRLGVNLNARRRAWPAAPQGSERGSQTKLLASGTPKANDERGSVPKGVTRTLSAGRDLERPTKGGAAAECRRWSIRLTTRRRSAPSAGRSAAAPPRPRRPRSRHPLLRPRGRRPSLTVGAARAEAGHRGSAPA